MGHGKPLGTSNINKQSFVNIDRRHEIRLDWCKDWTHLKRVEIEIILIFFCDAQGSQRTCPVLLAQLVNQSALHVDWHDSIRLGNLLEKNIVTIDAEPILLY